MEPLRQRKSMRLKGYDYSKNGCYFITICTKNKECLFGNIVDGAMRLNTYGKIANDELMKTAIKRRDALINNYVIMPNHVHILMTLYDTGERCCTSDTARRVPTEEQFGKPAGYSTQMLIHPYKPATIITTCAHVGTRRAVSDITSDNAGSIRFRCLKPLSWELFDIE